MTWQTGRVRCVMKPGLAGHAAGLLVCVLRKGVGLPPISSFLLKKFYLCIYLWLLRVFVATRGLSLVVASRGYSLVAVHGLLTAVAAPDAEPGL